MCRSRIALLFVLLSFTTKSFANAHLINLNYVNWAEEMTMTGGGVTTTSPANFSGTGIEYEYSPSKALVGWNASIGYISGQATGGNKSGSLIYYASYQKFSAITLKVSRFRRLYQRVYLEFGPLILMRPFEWPTDAGIKATSGSSTNLGVSLDLRLRLAPSLDFCQSIGALSTKASTIWSLGFGYRF